MTAARAALTAAESPSARITCRIAHSDKQQAAATFKRTWGHHPLTAWCDNTGENLALLLRAGLAGSNTVADHIEVLIAAIGQISTSYRRDLLITGNGAGAKDLLAHITAVNAAPGRRVHYSVGFDLDERARTAIAQVPEALWENVIDNHGRPRNLEDAGVVELTGLLRESIAGDLLTGWPPGLRVICRRERPHPRRAAVPVRTGRWLALPAVRHQHPTQCCRQARAAGLPQGPPPRPRPGRGLHPQRQEPGLGHLPSAHFALNQAWCIAAAIACDLLAWLRLLCLTGPLAKAEPKTLCYRLLHTAARLVRGQRKRKIRIPATWPWAAELHTALLAVLTLLQPA